MKAFLALLALLQSAGVNVDPVSIPGPNGVDLDAALLRPAEPATAPSIVALHGCGGPFPARDGQWAIALVKAGHVVLLPDSFGSRGLGSQCGVAERAVKPEGLRRLDAIAAAEWLKSDRRTHRQYRSARMVEWWQHGSRSRTRRKGSARQSV